METNRKRTVSQTSVAWKSLDDFLAKEMKSKKFRIAYQEELARLQVAQLA